MAPCPPGIGKPFSWRRTRKSDRRQNPGSAGICTTHPPWSRCNLGWWQGTPAGPTGPCFQGVTDSRWQKPSGACVLQGGGNLCKNMCIFTTKDSQVRARGTKGTIQAQEHEVVLLSPVEAAPSCLRQSFPDNCSDQRPAAAVAHLAILTLLGHSRPLAVLTCLHQESRRLRM